jgi:formate-dependent nitrite reductase membrane component NrfD
MGESADKKDVPFDAPWTQRLKHRPDPNRVSSLQVPTTEDQRPLLRPSYVPPDPVTLHAARSAPVGEPRQHDPQSIPAEPSYYNIPMLKPPVWEWMIAAYFFLGGLSSGAFAVSRVAERFGGERFKEVARVGAYVALLGLLPCPPLLIADLGDPKRFHHMLRVWKPGSPMNLGSWVITGYSGPATHQAVRSYLNGPGRHASAAERGKLARLMDNGTLLAVSDAAGVPLALLVASYTGVLLSTTSNPLWCKNPWLSPMFVSSALSTGAEAISLALDCTRRDGGGESAQAVLQNIDTAAHLVEGVMVRGSLRHVGERAAPLKTGKSSKYHHITTGAIVTAEVLKRIPVPPSLRRPKRMLCMALGLAGGLAMRWGLVAGGREAAEDPHMSRLVSRPKPGRRI